MKMAMKSGSGLSESIFFEDFRGKGIVVFDKLDKVEENHFNTVMKLASKEQYAAYKKNRSSYKVSSVTASGWYMGYLPIILLVALILASPVTWKRKGIALLGGLLVIHVFIWLKLYIQLLYEFNRAELNVVSFSGFQQNLMDTLHVLFVVYLGPTFIVPVFIWLLVTFRKGDLEMLKI